MSKLRVSSFTISLDGYGAGPDQGIENPLGAGGEQLHEWLVTTRTFSRLSGKESGSTGTDDDFAARGFAGVGAWIMGRNMFGPVRGPWPDESCRGWWGKNPPYHCAVFVLTRHPRAPLSMEGGTTFHFVTGGIHEALERAVDAAGGKEVRLGGGAATIREYLQAGPRRRAAPRGLADPARQWRAPARRHRPAAARIPLCRARADGARHALRPGQVQLAGALEADQAPIASRA